MPKPFNAINAEWDNIFEAQENKENENIEDGCSICGELPTRTCFECGASVCAKHARCHGTVDGDSVALCFHCYND